MTQNPHKRIIVLASDQLLSAGVESFLSNKEYIDVFGIDAKDPQEIYREIIRIQPDVIIMDQNNLMTDFSELLSNLESIPRVRTIILDLSDNQVQICERNRIAIQQISDFLSVL